MRSGPTVEGQASLPLDLSAAEEPPPAPRTPARNGSRPTLHHRLTSDALVSWGWPAGTELTLASIRTPRRDQVVLVREGAELRVGVFEVQLGRAALRNDHGCVWLGGAAEVLGVVTLASPPFAGMPGRDEEQ